jgi:hypothetical protein
MSNLIVLMSDEAGENDRLGLALTRTAPECQVAFAGSVTQSRRCARRRSFCWI